MASTFPPRRGRDFTWQGSRERNAQARRGIPEILGDPNGVHVKVWHLPDLAPSEICPPQRAENAREREPRRRSRRIATLAASPGDSSPSGSWTERVALAAVAFVITEATFGAIW